MATIIRPELSPKNKYWIEKHRYYELKHFCLQYPIWKKARAALDGLSKRPNDLALFSKTNEHGDPTARCAESMLYYTERMEMIEQCAVGADSELYSYILKGVTEGATYEHLKVQLDIPCSRDTYYDRYRKFFYLLNSSRK